MEIAAELTQQLKSLGWMAPDEADEIRRQRNKLERACGGAVVLIDGLLLALDQARECIDAGDVIGAHEILVRELSKDKKKHG